MKLLLCLPAVVVAVVIEVSIAMVDDPVVDGWVIGVAVVGFEIWEVVMTPAVVALPVIDAVVEATAVVVPKEVVEETAVVEGWAVVEIGRRDPVVDEGLLVHHVGLVVAKPICKLALK